MTAEAYIREGAPVSVPTPSPAEQEQRLECARIACAHADRFGMQPIDLATRLFAFVTGETDKSPRQQIMEALDRLGGGGAK